MAGPQPQSAPSLSIQKIYVKDLSLENPGAPQSRDEDRHEPSHVPAGRGRHDGAAVDGII